ncbi:MAG: hypothetical protein CEN89_690 [Candidatus Berkelbacteria bacterium Licking1014_7]|uniref:Uncharacterized protein n=1 Tax=Candidatus Berkelbacteria bacterium Licking1014_7 TaxID=2017147 RepID=A0A554LHW5_9BACT|nr:MAG: hypothetical protein CEN89_690 [Candidatus Berkelbacteria bacterium Licking1014_7]
MIRMAHDTENVVPLQAGMRIFFSIEGNSIHIQIWSEPYDHASLYFHGTSHPEDKFVIFNALNDYTNAPSLCVSIAELIASINGLFIIIPEGKFEPNCLCFQFADTEYLLKKKEKEEHPSIPQTQTGSAPAP